MLSKVWELKDPVVKAEPMLVEAENISQGLREITALLVKEYKTPDLGNLPDPLDELVFIITTFKTNDANYKRVFQGLREAFPYWESLLSAPVERVKEVMKPAGLSNQKAPRLVAILQQIQYEQGGLSLDGLRSLPDEEVEVYLRSFKGIGKKGARCIMLYSLGRAVFPVDTHTVRIFKRLGFLDWSVRPKPAQDIIQSMVPPAVRKDLHVNLVAHGRNTCLAKKPLCDQCCIREYCQSYTTGYFGPPRSEPW